MKHLVIFTKNGLVETTGQNEIDDWNVLGIQFPSSKKTINEVLLGYQYFTNDFNLTVINGLSWNAQTVQDYLKQFKFNTSDEIIFSYHHTSEQVNAFIGLFNLKNVSNKISHGTEGSKDARPERQQYNALVNSISTNLDKFDETWNFYSRDNPLNAKLKLLHDIHDGVKEMGEITIDPLIYENVKDYFNKLKISIPEKEKYRNSESTHLKALIEFRDAILSDLS